MSRGFVKEGDQEEAPRVPPRASLPKGQINYVTPEGYKMLLDELQALEDKYAQRQGSEAERRREAMVLDGRLDLLKERINSARILDPAEQPAHEVRFGARVKLQNLSGPMQGKTMELKIVGVDEADLKQQKISFVAPMAQAAAGKKVNEEFQLKLGAEVRKLKVMEINYDVS